MRFRIKDVLIAALAVDLPYIITRLNKVRILQDLGEEEALGSIFHMATIASSHIRECGESMFGPTRSVDSNECFPRPIPIHLISSDSVRIIVALNNLGSKVIDGVQDIQVYVGLRRPLCTVPCVPGPRCWSYFGSHRVVSVVTTSGQV